MKLADGQMIISVFDYNQLVELKGRVDGAQDLLNHAESVYLDDVCNVIGIDMSKYKERESRKHEQYISLLKDGVEENA